MQEHILSRMPWRLLWRIYGANNVGRFASKSIALRRTTPRNRESIQGRMSRDSQTANRRLRRHPSRHAKRTPRRCLIAPSPGRRRGLLLRPRRHRASISPVCRPRVARPICRAAAPRANAQRTPQAGPSTVAGTPSPVLFTNRPR
jgi:hypothetical protein